MTAPQGHNILRSIVERVENLQQERKERTADIADVMAEAKVHGLEPAIIREVIKLRKFSKETLAERNDLLKQYGDALGLDLL